MPRYVRLKKETFASGGNPIIDLSVLPRGYRVMALLNTFRALITQKAAGMTALTHAQQDRICKLVQLGGKGYDIGSHKATGRFLSILGQVMQGRDFSVVDTIPATASFAAEQYIKQALLFGDPNAADPNDTAPRSEFFKDGGMQLDFCDVAATFPNVNTITGSVQTIAVLEDADPGAVHVRTETNVADFAGQTIKLAEKDAGFTHLVAYKEDGTDITEAEVSGVTLKVDGEPVYDGLEITDLAGLFNLAKSEGASTTDDAEAIGDQPPDVTTGGDVSLPFVPLYVAGGIGGRYKAADALHAREHILVEYTGSLTNLRLGWRAVRYADAAEFEARAVKLGYDPNTSRPKTASKTDLDPRARIAGFIGRKFQVLGR